MHGPICSLKFATSPRRVSSELIPPTAASLKYYICTLQKAITSLTKPWQKLQSQNTTASPASTPHPTSTKPPSSPKTSQQFKPQPPSPNLQTMTPILRQVPIPLLSATNAYRQTKHATA